MSTSAGVVLDCFHSDTRDVSSCWNHSVLTKTVKSWIDAARWVQPKSTWSSTREGSSLRSRSFVRHIGTSFFFTDHVVPHGVSTDNVTCELFLRSHPIDFPPLSVPTRVLPTNDPTTSTGSSSVLCAGGDYEEAFSGPSDIPSPAGEHLSPVLGSM